LELNQKKEIKTAMSWCVVIPTYNNEKTLEKVLSDILAYTGDVIVVNDGSTDSTSSVLEKFPHLTVISYASNRGKGYALKKGFNVAVRKGYRHAITIDSDGQHYAKDIAGFVAKMKESPDALIVGSRKLPKDRMRKGSGFANRFSNLWFRFIAGVDLPDTQSGFRLYPLHLIQNIRFYTHRYEFELEVLVRSAWKGILVTSIPIGVYYPSRDDRVSHYRPVKDFIRISLLYTVLALIALLYIKPFGFFRTLTRENMREFFLKNILHSQDSTARITVSVMFGVFMGIAPIWGYQLITAIALAYLFRLNKALVIVSANISIPPVIPVIIYLSFLTGSIVLGTGTHPVINYPITFEFVKSNLIQYIVGSIILALIVSLFSGLCMFIILKWVRRNRVTIV
jgi:glycosyltransferase involved in cell wall biosynthesis